MGRCKASAVCCVFGHRNSLFAATAIVWSVVCILYTRSPNSGTSLTERCNSSLQCFISTAAAAAAEVSAHQHFCNESDASGGMVWCGNRSAL